ncbi:saccharopine dehydrogenase NADP-binding domain-containing protein [Saccharopolyspora sp. K220]|uniref:saccharopine dehydrogenase family protein n=1 Tax=Saccharopolyspora soli TaxID=2926618 RepID=UPI001F5AEC67|nr:saccharopine dehydrogenase NADP-binding domain-containing protein [Saccharopolyspora soli]MCI2421858.1 saccharopine dehydrogenase NADP-binding domain-containing protein [Saccharopolyspora soli]
MTDQNIAVYGASGFTGRLVVAELARRGIPVVLLGRDIKRLRKAATAAGIPNAELRVAPLDAPDALAEALRGNAAVINAAGPFSLWGEPVIRAAIAAGVHYVDTAGEQGYLKQVFDTFSAAAERGGVTVIPGLADDGGPGDLIAHLTAERVAQVDELTIADLRSPSGATRGTARSMLSVSREDRLSYRDGEWVRTRSASRSSIAVPGLPEAVPTIEFALPGVITIPRHVGVRRATSALRAEVAEAFRSITPELVDAMPEGPAEDVRRGAQWLMAVEVVSTDGQRTTGMAKGVDGYRTTAVIAVEGARRLVVDGAKPGVLAPAQAFDPADFLDFLAPFGVTWSIEPH